MELEQVVQAECVAATALLRLQERYPTMTASSSLSRSFSPVLLRHSPPHLRHGRCRRLQDSYRHVLESASAACVDSDTVHTPTPPAPTVTRALARDDLTSPSTPAPRPRAHPVDEYRASRLCTTHELSPSRHNVTTPQEHPPPEPSVSARHVSASEDPTRTAQREAVPGGAHWMPSPQVYYAAAGSGRGIVSDIVTEMASESPQGALARVGKANGTDAMATED